MKRKKSKLKNIGDLLPKWQFNPDRKKAGKYIKHEFQDYGIRLAHKLNDIEHKSLYIKLAKTTKRAYLERAYRFAIDYPGTKGKNKGKLFMWALSRVKKGENLGGKKKKKKYYKSKYDREN